MIVFWSWRAILFIKIGLASEYGGSSSGVDDGYWFKLTKTFPLANCKQVKVLKINFTAKCFLPAYQGLVFSEEPFSGFAFVAFWSFQNWSKNGILFEDSLNSKFKT